MPCDRTDDGHAEEEHGAGAAGRPHLGGTREEAGEDATHGELIEQGWCSRSEKRSPISKPIRKGKPIEKARKRSRSCRGKKKLAALPYLLDDTPHLNTAKPRPVCTRVNTSCPSCTTPKSRRVRARTRRPQRCKTHVAGLPRARLRVLPPPPLPYRQQTPPRTPTGSRTCLHHQHTH